MVPRNKRLVAWFKQLGANDLGDVVTCGKWVSPRKDISLCRSQQVQVAVRARDVVLAPTLLLLLAATALV